MEEVDMTIQTVNYVHYAEILDPKVLKYLSSNLNSLRAYGDDVLYRHDLRISDLSNVAFRVYSDKYEVDWFLIQEIDGDVYTIH
jgi:hypothetical protein